MFKLGAIVILASVGASLCLPALANAEDLRTAERNVTAKYPDGTVENYKAVYTGIVNLEYREDGHPSEPFKGWFTDTRQCHWSVETYVKRQVYQVSKNGHLSIYEPLTTVFGANKENKGSDLVLLNFRPENCNDAADRRNSDYNGGKNAVTNSFQHIVDTDVEPFTSKMKTDLQADTLVMQ